MLVTIPADVNGWQVSTSFCLLQNFHQNPPNMLAWYTCPNCLTAARFIAARVSAMSA